jgi:glycosyltransferase involved in cell wall biosynthesis
VTATVITFNEAANIEAALASLPGPTRSSSSTAKAPTHDRDCRKFTDKVIVRPWPGYIAQKNFAAEQARHDWIFSLDADERVTPELAAEITSPVRRSAAAGYRVPAWTFISGAGCDRPTGIPTTSCACTIAAGALVGEVRARVGEGRRPGRGSASELQHFAYRDLAHHLQTMDRYTTLAAKQMFEEGRGRDFSTADASAGGVFRNYVLRGGFRDGVRA